MQAQNVENTYLAFWQFFLKGFVCVAFVWPWALVPSPQSALWALRQYGGRRLLGKRYAYLGAEGCTPSATVMQGVCPKNGQQNKRPKNDAVNLVSEIIWPHVNRKFIKKNKKLEAQAARQALRLYGGRRLHPKRYSVLEGWVAMWNNFRVSFCP